MWISVESNFKQKHSESADLCKATSGPDLNDLQGTSLSKDTSQKNFHKILSVFCRDMSQIVEKHPILHFLEKIPDPDPEADDFQNLTISSLSKDVSGKSFIKIRSVIACIIAIAYSVGQIIKSFCVCQSVCVSVCPSASTLTVAFLDRFSPKLAQT